MESSAQPAIIEVGSRKAQLARTRAALLQAAVSTLIECGVSATTTLEVQKRAGVSRGALLHHFPTRAALLSATIQELVKQNEESVWRTLAAIEPGSTPLATAIRTMVDSAASPSNVAEMELWAVARTDPALRDELRVVERAALQERERVIGELFGELQHRPGYRMVVALTLEFARGLILSDILREDPRMRNQLIESWIRAAGSILDESPLHGAASHG